LSELAILIGFVLLPSCNKKRDSRSQQASVDNGPNLTSDIEVKRKSLQNVKPEFRSLIESFQKLLEKKRMDSSFYAQSALSLNPEPSIAAGKKKKTFLQSKGSYYTDEKGENFQSTILIQDGTFLWKYSDTTYGEYYFWGSLKLDSQSAEEFLESGGFIHNTYGEFDDELVSSVADVLEKGTPTTPLERENVTTTKLSVPKYGNLQVTVDSSTFLITRSDQKQETDKDVVSYKYFNSLPEKSQDPRPAFLAEFTKPSRDVKINVLNGEITWLAIFDEYFAHLTQVRNVATKEAMGTARKFGYLYPTKTPGVVKSAQTYYGQLSLSVEINGRNYMFHQFPPGNIDFSPLEHLTKRKRNAKGFEVLEVVIPANGTRVYYVKKDKKQMLIFDDPADFQDEKLDSFVQSLTVISPSKE
jgi:hypothetical protein